MTIKKSYSIEGLPSEAPVLRSLGEEGLAKGGACLPRRSGTKAGVSDSAITRPSRPSSRPPPPPKPDRFSWEGCDCAADSCATRGVSREHIRRWICKRRTTKPLRKKIKQARQIQLNRSGIKGRNCETNPISFKTCCPSITNNEEISFLLKSKSYDGEDRAPMSEAPFLLIFHWLRLFKPIQAFSRLFKAKNKNHFFLWKRLDPKLYPAPAFATLCQPIPAEQNSRENTHRTGTTPAQSIPQIIMYKRLTRRAAQSCHKNHAKNVSSWQQNRARAFFFLVFDPVFFILCEYE